MFGVRLQMEKLQMHESRNRVPMGKDHAGMGHDLWGKTMLAWVMIWQLGVQESLLQLLTGSLRIPLSFLGEMLFLMNTH